MPLDREQIVAAALELVDRDGLDAVTLRALAARLGVQAPTLYWHIRDKAALLDALADRVMAAAIDALPPRPGADDWRDWLVAAAVGLRGALLAHRDGARIVTGARDSLTRADFSEAAMSALVDAGVDLQAARLTVLAVERFTIGMVLEEEQLAGRAPAEAVADEPVDVAELQSRFPVATRAIVEYFEGGSTADDLFVDIVRGIVGVSPLA